MMDDPWNFCACNKMRNAGCMKQFLKAKDDATIYMGDRLSVDLKFLVGLENRAGQGHTGGLRQGFFDGSCEKRPDDFRSTWTTREVEVEVSRCGDKNWLHGNCPKFTSSVKL